jgi:hypothetical protein
MSAGTGPEQRAKWQRLVDAIFRGAEYMDQHNVRFQGQPPEWLN